MEKKVFEANIAGKKYIIETGTLAEQANGSVLVKCEDTIILATAVMSRNKREGVNFFPLVVDFEEKFYAAGKIRSNRFSKREGKPSDEAVLSGRLIDRTLRPLFNQKIRNDIQIVITVLSVDSKIDPEILGLFGASAALMISDIPFNGPAAGVRICKIDNKFVINPTFEEQERAELNLIVAGPNSKVNMIELGAKEVQEEDILKAIELAQKFLDEFINFQKEFASKIGKEKLIPDIEEINYEFKSKIEEFLTDSKIEDAIYTKSKIIRNDNIAKLESELKEFVIQNWPNETDKINQAEDLLMEKIDNILHRNILEYDKRPDFRKLDEIRELYAEVGLFPHLHGSSLFNRGTTQALAILTLGGPGDEQIIEGLEEEETKKRFLLHYNFPGFSVGEVSPMRAPGRREIGHGNLAEKAISPLIPDKENFPYTIRIVSEILSSNGSSSMASACAASMALMDGGVPIKKLVAGVSIGLILDPNDKTMKRYKIITDIQGPEDHHGDMDFKIAGTKDGITAIQLDTKVSGINLDIIENALKQAKKARLEILKVMEKAIKEPRPNLSPFAPRVFTIQIDPDKIREIIGPGGKIINEIIDATGVKIDIEDNGLVFITSKDKASADKALEWINNLTRDVKVGEVFTGKIVSIVDFGLFVEILPNKDGLVHISEFTPEQGRNLKQIFKPGDVLRVKVKLIDEKGRINLSLIK